MQREEERDNGFKSSDKLSARAERRNEGVYQNSFNSMTSDKTVTNLDLTTKNNNIMKDIQNCTGKCVCGWRGLGGERNINNKNWAK